MAKKHSYKYSYEYPRPCVSADCLVLAWQDSELKILLIKRGKEPYQNHWALPGGFLDIDEDLDKAAPRELQEETGLTNVLTEQFRTYGDLGRDPRARVITVAYIAMVRISDHQAQAADDAADAKWFPINRLPKLAFDHRQIVKDLKHHLRLRIRVQPFGQELLGKQFSMLELRELYEFVLGHQIAMRGFKKQLLDCGLVVEKSKGIFRFDKRNYRSFTKSGFSFRI